MALQEKKKKKLTRWIKNSDERFNLVLTDRVIEYFVLFCMVLLFDKIADIFKLWAIINYHKGVGFIQLSVAIICIIQMIRYSKRIKK